MAPTSLVKAPTSLKGTVSEEWGSQYGAILDEFLWDLPPELIWPRSIHTYATMQREPAIAAVLSGYGLQLRRASWQLDGRGCDPAHTQLVSDDMDLPIAGQDAHGAARTRGVSWSDHLRSALQSLTYGHMGHELGADISSGQARLVTLAERLPRTVREIHVDPASGAFLGVTQDKPRPDGGPQIPAKQMAWYAHERVGAAWQGTPLIKPCFGPWRIKREMILVNANSNQRWGAGIPVMEARPGTNPTPAQMVEAERMASAARGGSTAGASSPPDFQLRIIGLSGAVPDTLGFLQWLDTQISRAALMPHIELGQNGSGGSRSLGETFVNSWTLALEAIAEQIASDATRQIAARIIEWNFGQDVPVPRVTVSGVGSRREATAASLQFLLQSGALAPDPALEAWIRREYRLPPREGMALPAPSARGGTLAQANQPAKVTPADELAAELAQKDACGVKASAQRDLTPAEQASGADFEQVQADHDTAVAATVATLAPLLAPVAASLVAGVGMALTVNGVAGLAGLVADTASTAAVTGALSAAMVKLATLSESRAVAESAHLGFTVPAGNVDESAIRSQASVQAHLIVSGLLQNATRTAMLHAGPNPDIAAVEAAVKADLDALIQVSDRGWLVGNVASLMSAAQHAGRMAAFKTLAESGADVAFVSSEVNDGNQCLPCGEIDNTVFPTFEAAVAAYPTGRFVGCLGTTRCRGAIFAVKP